MRRKYWLWNPVGKESYFLVRLSWIVGLEVQAEIVLAAHVAVHHVFQRDSGAFTRLEGHRTDGRGGRSAPLLYFYIRRFGKAQGLVANIGDPDVIFDRGAKLQVTMIDLLFFDF